MPAQHDAGLPAVAQDRVESVGPPDGEQVDQAAAVDPDHVVGEKVFAHVRHVRLVEQGQRRCPDARPRECLVEGPEGGRLVTPGRRDQADRGRVPAPARSNAYWNTGPGRHGSRARLNPIEVATIVGASADVYVVAPATFNTINKIANGITDTLAVGLVCEALGYGRPVVVVPWFNRGLSRHGAYGRSLGQLGAAPGSSSPLARSPAPSCLIGTRTSSGTPCSTT